MKKNCPHCGSVNEDVQFCVNCGADIAFQFVKQEKASDNTRASDGDANTYCMQCGAELKAGARFCTKCGHESRVNLQPKRRCPVCKVELPDRAVFCPFCGMDLKARSTPSDMTARPVRLYTPTVPTRAVAPKPLVNLAKKNIEQTALTILKQVASSSAFLTGVIAYTLTIVFTFCLSISSIGGYFSDVVWMIIMIAMIPSVLIAIGLWMVYMSSNNRLGGYQNTAGLTLIKTIVVIETVLTVVSTVAMAIYVPISYSKEVQILSSWGISEDNLTKITIGYLIEFALVEAILICVSIYFVKVVKSINTAKRTIKNGIPDDQVSPFAGVMSFIIVAVCIIATIVALIDNNALLSLIYLSVAVSSTAFGIIIFAYRSKMKIAMMQRIAQIHY